MSERREAQARKARPLANEQRPTVRTTAGLRCGGRE